MNDQHTAAIQAAATKYGWITTPLGQGLALINRMGYTAAHVTITGAKYKICHMVGGKIATGNKDVGEAVETVIRDYFAGKLVDA